MSTDWYGGIEVRYPWANHDWYRGHPWGLAVDLNRLDVPAPHEGWGCLFGVFQDGWEPVAARRGLPHDVSPEVRADFEHALRIDPVMHSESWIMWDELSALDMTVRPAGRYGDLSVSRPGPPRPGWGTALGQWTVTTADRWPAEFVAVCGVPPEFPTPADAVSGQWPVGVAGELLACFQRVDRASAFGRGTGWDHVFAVMGTLARAFGVDGVRLVVYFDT